MNDDERRAELRLFLKERRARISPSEVGIPATSRRRVRGLRREEVASLAGIGVSWYTTLENGDAHGVSEATLTAVADALRLSPSERQYLIALTGQARGNEHIGAPSPLILATMHALPFPAYIITSSWDVIDCNDAFCRIWAVERSELPFNAFARLFLDIRAKKLHGKHFEENVTPVIGMLRSSHGRQPHSATLQRLRDHIMTDESVAHIWNTFDIISPVTPNSCTIESPLGTFRYDALTLPVPDAFHGIVIQIPDEAHRGL